MPKLYLTLDELNLLFNVVADAAMEQRELDSDQEQIEALEALQEKLEKANASA